MENSKKQLKKHKGKIKERNRHENRNITRQLEQEFALPEEVEAVTEVTEAPKHYVPKPMLKMLNLLSERDIDFLCFIMPKLDLLTLFKNSAELIEPRSEQ